MWKTRAELRCCYDDEEFEIEPGWMADSKLIFDHPELGKWEASPDSFRFKAAPIKWEVIRRHTDLPALRGRLRQGFAERPTRDSAPDKPSKEVVEARLREPLEFETLVSDLRADYGSPISLALLLANGKKPWTSLKEAEKRIFGFALPMLYT